jgi:hypothetical protein
MKQIKYLSAALIAITMVSGFYGCKKSYLTTNPSDAITDANLYTTTNSCYQVLDGIGRLMNTTGASYLQGGGTTRANDWGESTVRFEEDHMGIDMVDGVNAYDWFSVCYNYTGIRQPSYNIAQMPWRLYYKIINSANALLDHVDATLGPAEQIANLKGQAYAYRAYAYYKLSCYYCKSYSAPGALASLGLPMYLHATTASTEGAARNTVADVYKQIISDLTAAKTSMEAGGYISGRPISDISLPTFYGIYSKVALVMQDWKTAEAMSSLAITSFSGRLMNQQEYLSGFNSNTNPEWMWGSALTPSQTSGLGNTNFFSFADPTNPTSYANTGLTTNMAKTTLNIMLHMTDVRLQTFTAAGQQTKFHLADKNSWTYDLLYMRLAEMYLIKAEAQAEQSETTDAIATLTTLVKARNPTYDYNSNISRFTQANSPSNSDAAYFGATPLLKEIYLQRRIELFLEGVAYSDIQRWQCGLKRPSGTGNFGLSTAGKLSIPANDVSFLFKIPQQEMDANPAMTGQQNP